ncbi:response regulator transcription factor [Cellulomonas triticagri]|uniref:response regulator transcription factor n=1 Tax=Cellulomonas triticagri TaxID=2483352 RepID=UPI001F1AF225|nr:response regulator transcription factor [Cellulomonas triticagri]
MSLVEDEALVRSLLGSTLEAEPGIRVVHSVAGAQEAALTIVRGSTDVAVLDVNLEDGNGVSLGLRLQRTSPELAVVLLSSEDVMGLFDSVQEQVTRPWSYLSKRSSFTEHVLVDAVRAAARGEVVIDPYLVARSTPRAGSLLERLTDGQLRVLRLVAEGFSNQSIAERLEVGERTVESHLLAIYRRLGIDDVGTNRRVAAVLAFVAQTGRNGG